MTQTRRFIAVVIMQFLYFVGACVAADKFYISIPGSTLSYVPLYYGQEKGFFAQEGLELQVLVVRGIVGISSLMSGEIDVTCHAGSGFSAALRGV
jgi:ABC-type nitrate/sulfonate/bicarbonate transport system substrate-binding protein